MVSRIRFGSRAGLQNDLTPGTIVQRVMFSSMGLPTRGQKRGAGGTHGLWPRTPVVIIVDSMQIALRYRVGLIAATSRTGV